MCIDILHPLILNVEQYKNNISSPHIQSQISNDKKDVQMQENTALNNAIKAYQ